MKARKVILVEDDADDRDLFAEFFTHRKDIELLPAVGNGLELIKYLQNVSTDEGFPDLVVLDQNMPMMNGTQTLEFLKSNPRFKKIPAVIYSTYIDNNLIIDGKKLGVKKVVVKPIDDEGYQKMMDDFLQIFSV
jgi:CheY-like chemotaxis protein